MKIADSQVVLSSQHQLTEQHQQRERLELWRDGEGRAEFVNRGDRQGMQGLAVAALRHGENLQRMAQRETGMVQLSERAKSLQPQKVDVSAEDAADMSAEDRLQFLLLKALVERLTNRELELFQPADVTEIDSADLPESYPESGRQQGADREGWGLRYDYYESHVEQESVQFSAQATVRTADGVEISLDLELNMSREFRSTESISLRAGDALKDPLVINFDGNAVELTDTRYAFDLDVDGREDQIAFVGPGSGFLALDRNGNGAVDDGGELFGTRSGDGFADLAGFDDDGNGWIDEADSIYARLRIWSKSADGTDQLVALGERNVGAIYLGHIGTEFKLADADNQQLGQLRSSGLYLGNDGSAGTVQQVDLVV